MAGVNRIAGEGNSFTDNQHRASKIRAKMVKGDIMTMSRELAKDMDIFAKMIEKFPYTFTLADFVLMLTGRSIAEYKGDQQKQLELAFMQCCIDAEAEYIIDDIEVWRPGSQSHKSYAVRKRNAKPRRKEPRKRGDPLLNGKPDNGLGVLWH